MSCSPVDKGQAYLTLVCPVCKYGSVAWSPYTKKYINCVESVQRRAARFVCNDYRRTSTVNTMISNLGWQDLETRRRTSCLTIFFKIKTGNVRISFPNDLREVNSPHFTRARAQHSFHFQRFCLTLTRISFLFSLELSQFGTLCLPLPFMLTLLPCFIQVFVI